MTGEPVSGVVVAHARLASALVDAVERISGVDGALRPLSNQECAPEELEGRVLEEAGGGPAIVFVDLASGSCALAGRRVGLRRSDVAVVTGVNLPMLLDFVFHREMEVEALARRVVEKGGAGMELTMGAGSSESEAAPGPGNSAVGRPGGDGG